LNLAQPVKRTPLLGKGHQYTWRIPHWTREKIVKLDESCISNPKSLIGLRAICRIIAVRPVGSMPLRAVQFDISDISDFGFEVQDSSNFQFPFG
jgi:hypothetical protein